MTGRRPGPGAADPPSCWLPPAPSRPPSRPRAPRTPYLNVSAAGDTLRAMNARRVVVISLLLSALGGKTAHGAEPAWTSLFDGKTLKGWVQRGGNAKYEARDHTIVGTSVPNTKNSFLCTERAYGDFVLELEFKADPQLNSGIQIRGQRSPDYQEGRVHGYQVEIDPDVKRGRMWTGGLDDEGRRGWLVDLKDNQPARNAFRPEAWNKIRVEARGDSIKTWLNGVPAA